MSFAQLTPAQTDTWASHYATPGGSRWWPCEELVRAAGGRELGDVLEVGCGNGANLWYLASRTGGAVVGLDGCQQALDMAAGYARDRGCGAEARDSRPGRRVWNTGVRLLRGDIARLPFADASFDSLVDCMVSQHVRWADHSALYREYRRVLRPGGWLFLYHLSSRTTGAAWPTVDYARLALFPAAGLVCLPGGGALAATVGEAGFAPRLSGMQREYPNGDVAHYAVVTATAA